MRKRMLKGIAAMTVAGALLLTGAQAAGARVCEDCTDSPRDCGGSAFWNCEGMVRGY